MKKIAIQFLILITISQAAIVSAANPVWILNGGTDVNRISSGQANLSQEAGLTRLVPIGTDATLTLRLPGDKGFSADAYPFFALRYKYKTQFRQAGLFFTNDILTELSDKTYSQFPVEPDNTWRSVIVDMRLFSHKNWSGTITGVRLDPTNPSAPNDVLQLSRFGFFPTRKAAETFLAAAVDAPDYSEPTVFRAPFQTVFVPGNSLSDGYRQEDYLIRFSDSARPSLPCGNSTVVVFTANEPIDSQAAREDSQDAGIQLNNSRNKSAVSEIVPVCQTNSCGYTRFVALKPGKYFLENRSVSFDDMPNDPSDVQTIQFVACREILGAASQDKPSLFAPNQPISPDDWQKLCAKLAAFDVSLDGSAVPDRRIEAARAIHAAIKSKLGAHIESKYTNKQITRDRIRIGAWVSVSDDVFQNDFIKTYAQGGFDWIIAHSGAAAAKNRDILLRDCDRYGVELILNDGAYLNPVEQTAEYFDHPCFAGTYITDEPGSQQYDKLAEISNRYVKQTSGKVPYINLLPMYANAAQLKFGAGAADIEYYDSDPNLFRQYCDSFCEKFEVDYICTDIYPLNWVKGKRVTYKDYVESINVIASSARKYNKTFWCCLQTFAWIPSKRTPTESEFRWQAYTLLSFGCKGLLCWTYAGGSPEFPSLITQDGHRTNAWYDAATVFKEIKKISDVFVQYDNLGAFTLNQTEAVPYLRMTNPIKPQEDFPLLQKIDSPAPLLIGCFKPKNPTKSSEGAFTLVNMSELEAVESIDVQFQITPGLQVIAWPQGVRQLLQPDDSGYYRLTLPSGAGVFVECKKK